MGWPWKIAIDPMNCNETGTGSYGRRLALQISKAIAR